MICDSVVEDAPGLTDVHQIHESVLSVLRKGQTKTTVGITELYLWVRLYADDAPGDYDFDLRFLSPSGKGLARQTAQSMLTDDGLSAVIPIHLLTTEESGIHHFEVGIDGRLLTRVPFQIELRQVGEA